MMKIGKLTPEQEAELPRFRHEATRELVEGAQRAAQIIERNLYRQSEKIEDAKAILNELIAKYQKEQGVGNE